ncbi:MAG: DNA repair protein RecN [Clostridia bacterium]|nr:DNA repair protein RecN [Clostridia bacterium]
MLNRLLIKNVALIESAEIDFTAGFNILSGETGSGKSVILESLNFVLGAKADKTLIRSGETDCSVSAEFGDISEVVYSVLDEFGFDREDVLIITRKFSLSGKNTIAINGNSATVSMVKKLTSLLIDVHGQSEHFYLLNAANQLKLIDKLSGLQDGELIVKAKAAYAEYKKLNEELSLSGGDEAARLIKADVLNYQIKEIESADVKENEFEELTALKDKLLNREKIVAALSAVKSGIEDEGGVSDILSNVSRALSGISAFGEDYSALSDRLSGAIAEIDDILSTASDKLDDIGYSEYSLDETEERLNVIKNLFKKYGGDYRALTEFYENAAKEKERLDNFAEYADKLQNKIISAQKELYSIYTELGKTRRAYAEIFAKNVLKELTELGMGKSQFFIKFNDVPPFEDCKFNGYNGFDEISFMFSANSGEPVKPLSDVISGGEMSRFMLSIKAQTAKCNDISTFIFDEIDAGISGAIAWVVAEKLVRISTAVQVIAVSHLPQIASFADNNILIEKTETADKTITTVKTLDEAGKINEIIRLSGGEAGNASAEEHAKSLIKKAEEYKTNNITNNI